jgi:cell division protein FtsB
MRRLAVPLAGRRKKSETPPQKNVPSTPSARSAPAKAAPAKQKKPARQKTPASPDQRRRRIPVAIAGAFALAVLATSFPLSSILSQHHQLAAVGAQLEQVQRENRDLAQQEHALDSSVAVTQWARGEYQMVTPGQTLYDVLPPSSRTGRSGRTASTGATGATTPGSAVNGDPGNQPMVAPSNAPDLTAQAALAQPTPVEAAASTSGVAAKGSATAPPAASTAPSTPTTFWGRVGQTLQFWK